MEFPRLIEVQQGNTIWTALVIGDEAIVSRMRVYDLGTNAQGTVGVDFDFWATPPKRPAPAPPTSYSG